MKSSDLEKIVAERAAKRAFALVTNLKSGTKRSFMANKTLMIFPSVQKSD